MCHRLLEAEGATNKVPATRKKNKKPRQSPDTVDARAPVQPQLDFSDGDDDMKEQSDPEDLTAAVPSQDLFAKNGSEVTMPVRRLLPCFPSYDVYSN